jgi:hypothetical protein
MEHLRIRFTGWTVHQTAQRGGVRFTGWTVQQAGGTFLSHVEGTRPCVEDWHSLTCMVCFRGCRRMEPGCPLLGWCQQVRQASVSSLPHSRPPLRRKRPRAPGASGEPAAKLRAWKTDRRAAVDLGAAFEPTLPPQACAST